MNASKIAPLAQAWPRHHQASRSEQCVHDSADCDNDYSLVYNKVSLRPKKLITQSRQVVYALTPPKLQISHFFKNLITLQLMFFDWLIPFDSNITVLKCRTPPNCSRLPVSVSRADWTCWIATTAADANRPEYAWLSTLRRSKFVGL